VLILAKQENEQHYSEVLKAGASGYVVNAVADRDLLRRAEGQCVTTVLYRRSGDRSDSRRYIDAFPVQIPQRQLGAGRKATGGAPEAQTARSG
jgi:hypothetical protein